MRFFGSGWQLVGTGLLRDLEFGVGFLLLSFGFGCLELMVMYDILSRRWVSREAD